MRPCSKSSAHTSLGKPKWAAWSPCRWPISRRPTLKANSPRRPGPASTPGHDVTSSVICWLGVRGSVMKLLQDQIDVAELVPEVAVLRRGAIGACDQVGPADRLEHVEV